MPKGFKIFSGTSNRPLAEKICKEIGVEPGNCEIKRFSDGEIWVKYADNIRGSHVFIIQSTNTPAENLMELLIMIDAAKRASASEITAVIPYFGYSRQDRKDQPRVAISAKLVANLITVAGATRVITMDLHAAQVQGFFDIPFDHLYASYVYMNLLKNFQMKDLAVVSPDVGGIKLARAYAKRLNANLVVIDKRRPKHNEIEIASLIGDVQNKNVLLFDDLIDTGGTFAKAVHIIKEKGAKTITGFATHAIFSGNANQLIKEAPIDKLYITDSTLITENKLNEKIEVVTTAGIFAEAIKRTFKNMSISSLFATDKG